MVKICPRERLFQLDLQEVWNYRELLYFLVWREVKVRYKQTAIGVAWVLLQPLLTMAIFTVIFGFFAKLPSDGLPYPVFAYAALLPWTYFSEAVSRSGLSLVGDANLLRKVYFPRLIIPLAAVLAPLVDFCLSFSLFLCLMMWYGISPTLGVFALPFLLFLALVTALAMGLWLAALNVRYRDVRHAIPFLIQFLMYASPVAYAMSVVPERWRALYSLNPMVGVIEGFRWGLLGKANPDFHAMTISALGVLMLLIGGLLFFKQMERTFADVV
ncbi:MAG: ABC transporter permease [Candidatus Binatia bacterium]